ncbi:MAG: GH3 auxin-responsive promoter family protein [Acidobacteriota bacterium]
MLKLLRSIIKPFLHSHLSRFKNALQHPESAQTQVLEKIVAAFAQTQYGRSLNIRATDDYQNFAAKTPLVTYDDLSEWLTRQRQSEKNILVAEPVRFYEKTSGSAAAAKLIPYTQSLKNSFNRMFFIWLADLLDNLPGLQCGKTFISISPAFQQNESTEQDKRVGLADDAEYLNRCAQALLKPFLVLPPAIKRLQEPMNFKHALALTLLAEARLEIISIWNPSFFEIILDYLESNTERLTHDLRRGAVTLEGVEFTLKPASDARLALLKKTPILWDEIWREVKLISCWTSAQAKPASLRLAAKFPDAFMQGKGLLATEAPMTLPLIEAHGFAPLLTEVFFEFLDERNQIKRLHELEIGSEYAIILTQQGGLYRYLIGDRVRVTGIYQATPCLEFVGRTAEVCDLVGEKLNAQFVGECFARLSTRSDFQILMPVMNPSPHYLLVVDKLTTNATVLQTELDTSLQEAFHYRQARMLGQLGGVQVLEAPRARDIYFTYYLGKGQKFGDIKPRHLISDLNDATKLRLSFK